MRILRFGRFICLAFATTSLLQAAENSILLRGKVTMADGAIPEHRVSIEKHCPGFTKALATTNVRGEYQFLGEVGKTGVSIRVDINATVPGGRHIEIVPSTECTIRAALTGYQSNSLHIGDLSEFSNPILPTLTLTRLGAQPNFDMLSDTVPPKARNQWNDADKAVYGQNWARAEKDLRGVVAAAPGFALGWQALGNVFQYENNRKEAIEAYTHAVELDPRLTAAYLALARLKIADQDWAGVNAVADGLIQANPKQQFPEAYVYRAIAQYEGHDFQDAETSAKEAIALDHRHEVPMGEYVLGLILEARREYTGASEHLNRYLAAAPKSAEAEGIRARIQNMGKANTEGVESALAAVAKREWQRAGVAWVPGGMKALARVAHIPAETSPENFFTEFFTTVAAQTSFGSTDNIPQYLETLRVYMASVTQLSALGVRGEEGTVVTLSTQSAAERDTATRALALIGWHLNATGKAVQVEPGHEPSDGPKQRVANALGIDAIAMQQALQSGQTFQLVIPTEDVPFRGVEEWTALLSERMKAGNIDGGLAGTFLSDIRLAKVYAGLGSMNTEAASAVLAGIGLRDAALRYSDLLFRYGSAFRVTGNRVAVPGGEKADAVWRKLAGASPENPPVFFRALLEKDHERLAAYYSAVAGADAPHQAFFTRNAESFYPWYRDSSELFGGPSSWAPGWRLRVIRELPLEADGRVHFPGGRHVWNESAKKSDTEVLTEVPEAFIPVSQVEIRRHAPLDEESAGLLARNYSEWRALFPYFESLPELIGEDFSAFDRFARGARTLEPTKQDIVIGYLDTMLELIARAKLNPAAGAKAFRDLCDGLRSPNYSARVFDVLREIGGDDVPHLLHLSGERVDSFHRIMELQHVPPLESVLDNPAKDPAQSLAALSGMIYAASLAADGLLVNEDPQLLSRHRFVGQTLFQESAFVRPGGRFTGSFVNFERVAARLASGGSIATQRSSASAAAHVPMSGPAESEEPVDVVFRSESRLVEVYTTVTDSAGRFVDNLKPEQFRVLEAGAEQKLVAFEPQSADVSVALLLDTTGSMEAALPALKNAAFRLIEDLRPADSVAVYTFSDAVRELQPFTTEKGVAEKAILTAEAYGNTALYDALTRVGRDLAGRGGKKVIIVFTDGNDNWSTLNTEIAIGRARAAGIPIYTVAEGNEMQGPFLRQLGSVSKATGGSSFVIRDPKEIRAVFEKISKDLAHGYLLVFEPPLATDQSWHAIDVRLQDSKGYKIRAREGYNPN